MDQAIVAANPQGVRIMRRLRERKYGAVHLRTCVVARDGSARRAEFLRIVTCQIWADDVPARSEISRTVKMIARRVQHIRIVHRERDRKGPLKTVLELFGTHAP